MQKFRTSFSRGTAGLALAALVVFFLSGQLAPVMGQGNPAPSILYVTAAPVGACGYSQIRIVRTTGEIWGCVAGTWTVIQTTGGSADWTTITNKPSTFAPSTHHTSHETGGTDVVTVTKSQVGLSNVDNTSDANKPVSTAQATAIGLKADKTTTVNGHALSSNVTVTKTDVGLANVPNTDATNASNISSGTLADARSNFGNAASEDPGHVHSKLRKPNNSGDALTTDNSGYVTTTNTRICPDNVTETGTAVTLSGATHNGCNVVFTSDSDVDVTVPTGLTSGFNVHLVQGGLGKLHVIPVSASVTVLNADNFTQTRGPGAQATVSYVASNKVALDGGLQIFSNSGGGVTHFISSFGACGNGTANMTSQVQAAADATNSGEILSFDCKPYLVNVSIASKSNITVTATPGNGFFVYDTGALTHDDQGLNFTSCSGCTVQNLDVDAKQVGVSPIRIATSDNFTVKNCHLANTGNTAYAIIRVTGSATGLTVDNNLLEGTLPIFASGTDVATFEVRGIWAGEGSEYQSNVRITNNTGNGVPATFIVVNGTNAYIAGNHGNALPYACIKLATDAFNTTPGTSTVENNECHGALNGWTFNSTTQPANGGAMQIGMIGTNNETVIVQDNWFDGGDSFQAVAGVHNAVIQRNYLTDAWSFGILVNQRSNSGTLLIDRNVIGLTHAKPTPPAVGATGSDYPLPNAIEIGAYNGCPLTLSNITISNNLMAYGHYRNLHIVADPGCTVDQLSITGNSFIGKATTFSSQTPWGIEVEGGGTITNVTQSGNCFTNHGSGSINNNGITSMGNPAQSGSCANPTGKALPPGFPAIP